MSNDCWQDKPVSTVHSNIIISPRSFSSFSSSPIPYSPPFILILALPCLPSPLPPIFLFSFHSSPLQCFLYLFFLIVPPHLSPCLILIPLSHYSLSSPPIPLISLSSFSSSTLPVLLPFLLPSYLSFFSPSVPPFCSPH